MDTLPPTPRNGRCLCGAVLWYVRAEHVGERGRFECRRCRRAYREWEPDWTPGGPMQPEPQAV